MDYLIGDISKRYWEELKKDAADRNIAFLVTPEETWKLFLSCNKKCNMTGQRIDMKSFGYRGTASLDRIDSFKPYVLHNLQWVHKDVQMMKNSLHFTYFKKLCKMVVNTCCI